MTKRFLNVEYSVYKTRINVTDMEDLSEVRRAIKAELSIALSQVDAPQLLLYTANRDQLITDLDDITPEKTPQYYQKLTQGGCCVVIATIIRVNDQLEAQKEIWTGGSKDTFATGIELNTN